MSQATAAKKPAVAFQSPKPADTSALRPSTRNPIDAIILPCMCGQPTTITMAAALTARANWMIFAQDET
jgi:hypothetical protein